jgi:hypothetical protein
MTNTWIAIVKDERGRSSTWNLAAYSAATACTDLESSQKIMDEHEGEHVEVWELRRSRGLSPRGWLSLVQGVPRDDR